MAQRKSTSHSTRSENFKRLYRRELRPLHLDAKGLTIMAITGAGHMSLDGVATSFDWEDSDGFTATLNLEQPDDGPLRVKSTEVGHGTRIRVHIVSGGTRREFCTMRVWDPEHTLAEDSFSFPLYEDDRFLRASRDNFMYRKHAKRRPRGWLVHDIVRDVARRYHIPLGKIAKGKHRIKKLELKNVSPMDVIIKAYRLERQANGARFVIRWINGRLNILPMERGRIIYRIGSQLTDGVVTDKRARGFCTALTARATIGKGNNRKKIMVKVSSKKAQKRYGYIHKQITIANADTRAELADKAKRELAERLVVKKRISLEHAGLATLRRGDIIDLQGLKDEGFRSVRDPATGIHDDIFWVTSVSGSWSSGGLSCSVEVNQNDPFKDPNIRQKLKDKKKRQAKRKRRA